MTHKIALFRALYLGDMLLAVPAFRALRQHFPQAEITLIGLPWAATFVEIYSEYLDRFVAFVGYPGLPEVEVCPEHIRAFIEDQRAYHYDLAIQMHGNGQYSNLFLSELGAERAVGYFPEKGENTNSQLTIGAPYPLTCHEIERNLGLARLLDCTRLDHRHCSILERIDILPSSGRSQLEEWYMRKSKRSSVFALEALPLDEMPWIGFHIGAKHPARRWPPAYFAELADTFAQKLHACIILTGSADEITLAQEVISHMVTEPINLVGQTSLGDLAALLSMLDLFISNDTGPAHLAYVLDTPSITLFGPTDYQRWRPLDQRRHMALRVPVACSPCTHQVCPIDHRCLKQIQPAQVEKAAAGLLQNTSASDYKRRMIPILSPKDL